MPSDDVDLLKLLWCPDDFDEVTGKVKPSVFRKKELDGKGENHVSVDSADLSRRDSMEQIAARQQEKANGQNIKRESARIGRVGTRLVRVETKDELPLFEVKRVPLEENVAHCGIFNISGKTGRGDIDELQTKLARLFSNILTFDEAYC